MALSPGIPTSFVPKQPVQPTAKRPMSSGSNLFLTFTIIVAGITLAIAVGIFAYNKYLQSTLASRQAELSEAQGKVDEATVQDFIHLRDRLSSGKDLLTNHIALSQFFDALEKITLTSVRFDTLSLIIASDHSAKLDMSGTARSFNALAVQSNAFASEKRIKRAIFSDISLDKDRLVSFKMTADIDPKLVIEATTQSSAATVPTTATTPAQGGVQLPQTSTSTRPAATTPVASTPQPPPAPTTQTATTPVTATPSAASTLPPAGTSSVPVPPKPTS